MENDSNYWKTIIIGAGPIGIETAIALQRAGVENLLIEAKQIGDAFANWPPNTYFYSTPEHVALAGVPVHNLNQQPISGEQYLAYLRTLVEMFDLNLRIYEPVTEIDKEPGGFILRTISRRGRHTYKAKNIIFATGGMAKPRMLNIPGEDLAHVTHYFPGPHPYFRTRVLIIGGRNSAIESALRCWRAGAQVTISYRRQDLDLEIIKPHLAMDIGDRLQKNEVELLPATIPVEITPTYVRLAQVGKSGHLNGNVIQREVDFVVVCTGFEADMSLLGKAGISLQGLAEVPVYNPQTMETNISGIYVAGTAVGGTQERFKQFISTSHDHVGKIVKHISGHYPDKLGTIPARNSAVTYDEVKAN